MVNEDKFSDDSKIPVESEDVNFNTEAGLERTVEESAEIQSDYCENPISDAEAEQEEPVAPKRIIIKYDEEDIVRKQQCDPKFKIEREYAKMERNEKGLIKRSGYATKVSYGEEFEKENLNKVLIFTVIMTALLLIGGLVGIIYLVVNALDGISILF